MRRLRKNLKKQGIKYKWNSKNYTKNCRKRAFDALGGPVCVNCGCDAIDILEINHIDGGGNKEHRELSSHLQFYREVVKNPSKYNVLCKVCNALHYVNDILKISGHKVTYER